MQLHAEQPVSELVACLYPLSANSDDLYAQHGTIEQ